ncbi:TonB-dependent siderophore receptor [uncultured Phascolarctobacterium sp.]|mgnify:CR=1 FL=1|uniref:TonB-dependent receptor plug domain-containing protein n=1 Tax=uncultured Phascolarctobacterium sp. TaxID=512296 RepID=UPI00260050D4|nr:TonB-dependent receptor [uncultured Phascolarctobacterium sp.]
MKRLSKKRLALLTLCICSAIANSGFAAETGDLDVYGGDEFVVTATRTKLEAKEVPVAAEVITEQKIKDLGAYNVRDALRIAANIDVQEAGMTGNQVMVRGMESKHTLVLIDGRRMAGENTGSTMNVYELNRINLADIERIEVIRGNGSALYGSDAMGGVINIITKKATKPRASIETHAGSKDNGVNFSYASGREGNLSFKASGGLEKVRKINDSYFSKKYKGDVTGTNMNGIRRFLNLGFDYSLGQDKGLALDMNFMKEQFVSDGYTPTIGSSYHNYKNNRSDYALTYYGKDAKNDYNVRAYYNTLKKIGDSFTNGTVVDFDLNNYDTFVIETKNSYKADEHNTFTYGVEYNDMTMNGTLLGGAGDSKSTATYLGINKDRSEKDSQTYAAYLQDEWKVNDKLLIIPAVRVDHHDSFGTHASPKIGATYDMSNNSRVKVNYGKGYRAPTLFELYSEMKKTGMAPGMTVQVLGNSDLDPEESTNFDISLEGEQGKVTGKVTYFHNDIKNLIDSGAYTYKYDPLIGMIIESQYENIEEAQIKGVEAEAGYHFDDKWGVKVTYNYLDAQNKTTNMRLNNRARQSGTVQLTYTDGKELPLTATLWSQWYIDYLYRTSETVGRDTVYHNNNYTFNTVNFVVNKQFTKNLRAYAGIDNIFDKKLLVDDIHSYSIDGRMWRVGAEMTF